MSPTELKLLQALKEAVAWADRMAAKGNPPMQAWVVPARMAIFKAESEQRAFEAGL